MPEVIASDGRLMHTNSLSNLTIASKAQTIVADQRKDAFLKAVEKFTEIPGKYPVISHVLKALSIPRGTFVAWLQKDEIFKQEYHDLMECFDDSAIATLFEGIHLRGGASLAFGWLRARKPKEWGEKLEHSGQIGTINLIANVGRPMNEHGSVSPVSNEVEEGKPKALITETSP